MQQTFSEIALEYPPSFTESSRPRLFALDGSDGKALLVEPYTWEWLALNVAEGAIGGIAGELAVRALFGGSDKPIDFAKLLVEFVKAVEGVVKNALAEEAHRKLDVELGSLKSLVSLYQAGHNEELLTPLQMKANQMTFEAVSLGLPCIPAFCVAGGIEMMVLREQFLRGRGSQSMLKQRAIELTAQSQDFVPKIAANADSRVVPYKKIVHGSSGGGYPQDRIYWLVAMDGVLFGPAGNSRPAVEPLRLQKVEELRGQLERSLLNPVQIACQQWHRAADAPAP